MARAAADQSTLGERNLLIRVVHDMVAPATQPLTRSKDECLRVLFVFAEARGHARWRHAWSSGYYASSLKKKSICSAVSSPTFSPTVSRASGCRHRSRKMAATILYTGAGTGT
jgi:hypothetical protein